MFSQYGVSKLGITLAKSSKTVDQIIVSITCCML